MTSPLGSASFPLYFNQTMSGAAATNVPSLDAVGALALGAAAATTAISIGQATVAPSFTGGLTIASAKAVTGSGAMAVEATGALSLGVNASSTSIVIGQATVAPSFTGGLTIASAKAVTGSGAMAVEATGALSLGVNASSTSIVIGQATVAPSFTGGLTIASAKAVTGSGAMAVEATGALTIAGAASTTSSLIGRAGNVTTIVGKLVTSQGVALTVTTPPDAAYTALVTDCIINFPSAAAPRTITLPVSVAGQTYIINSVNANSQTITIAISGGTVNGTPTITTAYGRRIVTCDGTNAVAQ